MNKITKHVIKHNELPPIDQHELNKWAVEVANDLGKQKEAKIEIIEQYINLFLNYSKLMDKYVPEWRHFAKDEINQLKSKLQ
ncbi:hypothetical protein [Paenibacillus xylaniclasticus]|uniref:hypothetical protein n=1 Tax=Paenibacillus xylaniclasticus TaxID=588083 RepID=UPI000FDA4F20|nr:MULTISPECIES: hypothetical protein [Paenibacillus]GFN32407.1 hypothetical protein PCURB6_26670 [Paenibacillus curdlanolyticus]